MSYNTFAPSRSKSILCLTITTFALWMFCVACSSAPDPILEAIQKALRDEEQNPTKTFQVLSDDLDKVKDKQVIELLVNYLEDNKRNKTPNGVIDNFNTMGIVALYLERVTGLKSHMDFTFAGPAYRNTMLWDQDILQWRGWWSANKDYIYWDEQAQSLKVKPH
jgi:hypothetical protein